MITMIKMFIEGHIVAGVFVALSTVAWAVQGLGNAFYYRQVRSLQQPELCC